MLDQVTVVIPTKDRSRVLTPLINSVLKNSKVKTVFILNNSASKIRLSANLDDRVKVYNLPDLNLLQAKNYISGFIATRWVLILDDDIRINPDVIDSFINYSKNYYFDIASGILTEENRYSYYDPVKFTKYGKYSFYGVPSLNTENLPAKYPYRAQVVPGGFMFLRSFVLQKISFDTNYLPPFYNEDSDFQLTALKIGYIMLIFNDISALHLKHKSGGLRVYSKFSSDWWYALGFNNIYFRVKNFNTYKLFLYFVFRPQDLIFVIRQKNLNFLINFLLGQLYGYKKAKKG